MMGSMYGMGWGWLFLILVVIVVVVGVMAVSRGRSSGPWSNAGPPPHEERRAEEILKERYARGEITRDEYEEMRRTL